MRLFTMVDYGGINFRIIQHIWDCCGLSVGDSLEQGYRHFFGMQATFETTSSPKNLSFSCSAVNPVKRESMTFLKPGWLNLGWANGGPFSVGSAREADVSGQHCCHSGLGSPEWELQGQQQALWPDAWIGSISLLIREERRPTGFSINAFNAQ